MNLVGLVINLLVIPVVASSQSYVSTHAQI